MLFHSCGHGPVRWVVHRCASTLPGLVTFQTPSPNRPSAEIGPLPRRDRSTSGSKSVVPRTEIGPTQSIGATTRHEGRVWINRAVVGRLRWGTAGSGLLLMIHDHAHEIPADRGCPSCPSRWCRRDWACGRATRYRCRAGSAKPAACQAHRATRGSSRGRGCARGGSRRRNRTRALRPARRAALPCSGRSRRQRRRFAGKQG